MKTKLTLVTNNIHFGDSVTISGKGKLLIGKYVDVEKNVLFDLGESKESIIQLGYRSKIKYGSVLRNYNGLIDIGERTTIGEYNIIAGHGGVTIGNNVMISGHCYIAASEHIYTSDISIRFQGETAIGIAIADGVWIGANCTILDGISIGENTIVGAGSVVTRSLPSDYICWGAPCKPIKKIMEERNVCSNEL
ncbi:MAG: acyltransferase [Thermodesulfovibrionia bacterium]|nr:acyltransferase [Thermodesulfovibrionia bacterium]